MLESLEERQRLSVLVKFLQGEEKQSDLARKLGVTSTAVSLWKKGNVSKVEASNLEKIAGLSGKTYSEVMAYLKGNTTFEEYISGVRFMTLPELIKQIQMRKAEEMPELLHAIAQKVSAISSGQCQCAAMSASESLYDRKPTIALRPGKNSFPEILRWWMKETGTLEAALNEKLRLQGMKSGRLRKILNGECPTDEEIGAINRVIKDSEGGLYSWDEWCQIRGDRNAFPSVAQYLGKTAEG